MIRSRFAILLCVAAVAASRDALADEDPDGRPTITVTGTGKVSTVPDMAEINVGVVSQETTALDAINDNKEAMTKLHATLKEHGVADKDVQTTQVKVTPQYAAQGFVPNGPHEPRISGYRVESSVRVTARHVAELCALLDALVMAGANQVHGISFRVSDPEKLLDDARQRAMADARRKAMALATEAGVVVGRPLKIQEGGGPSPPTPLFARAPMVNSAAVPISVGEEEMSVTVLVVYELRPS